MANQEIKTVVALRRYNPGRSGGNRAVLEPIFVGEKINKRWNLISPPEGKFRIASLWDCYYAGASPRGDKHNEFEGHPLTASGIEVCAKNTIATEGLVQTLISQKLVTV